MLLSELPASALPTSALPTSELPASHSVSDCLQVILQSI